MAKRKTLADFYVGICPACSKPVPRDEPDGPVWTCPADLDPRNPYWEPQEGIAEAMREKAGVFSNCWEDFGRPCYDRLPLHSACYDKESY
jgi:hypothetical protein